MRLIINGTSIAITHMGHDFVLVGTPVEHSPCEASILLKVDESESQWRVTLPQGMSGTSKRVELAVSK